MWRTTIKGLLAHKVRLALTALAVVLGVGFVVGTYVLTDTINRAFDNLFQDIDRGVAVYITNRDLVLLQQVISTAGTDAQYSDLMLNPLPGFAPIAHEGRYSAYVRC